MRDAAAIREIKRRERRLRRAARIAVRDQRRMARRDRIHEIRCFWTWPLGHVWHPVEGGKRCGVCWKGMAEGAYNSPSGPADMSVRRGG